MLNLIKRMTAAVLTVLCVGTAGAADYTNTITGGYNANATWGAASNPGNTNIADNVEITNGTVTIQFAYAASNDTIQVQNLGTLSTGAIANGLNGSTVIVNDGGWLTLSATASTLTGAVIRLNGGSLYENWGAGTYVLNGAIQIWGDSTITNASPATVGHVATYDSLDFTVDGRTLTFAAAVGSSAGSTELFREVTITNDATIVLAKTGAGIGSVSLNLSNVTLSSTKTLNLTNSTDGSRLVTIVGTNNYGVAGNIAVHAGINLTPAMSNALGSALVNINDGGVLTINTAYGLSSTTNIINSGGRLVFGTVANSLAGGLVHLNGGIMVENWGAGTALPNGVLEVLDHSTISNAVSSTTGHNSTYRSLTFVGDDKSLTFISVIGGNAGTSLTFSNVVVDNTATLVLARSGAGGGAQNVVLSNVLLTTAGTLAVTNSTGSALSRVTFVGSNPDLVGNLEIHTDATVFAAGSNALGSANVRIGNGGTLAPTAAFAMSTGLTTIDNGGWLRYQNTANMATGQVIRLNGGTWEYSVQGFNYGSGNSPYAFVEVWDNSSITNHNNNNSGGMIVNEGLDFVVAGKTLTFSQSLGPDNGGVIHFFRSVMVSNDATVALGRFGSGTPSLTVRLSNVTVTAGTSLAVTNSTGDARSSVEVLGDNTNFAGTLDVRAGATVNANVSGVLGTATLFVNGGTLTYGNVTAGVNDLIVVSNGTFRATTAVRSYIVGNGRSNQVVQVIGSGSIFSNSAAFVVGTNAALNNVVTLANDGVLHASAINIGTSPDATGNSLIISNGGFVRGGTLTIGNNGSTGNFYHVLGGGIASNGVLTIGGNRSGFNTLSVSNATLLSGGAAIVGSGSSNNTVTISSGGTWDLLGNQLTLGSGAARDNQLVLSGGTVVAGNLIVTGGANRVTFDAGTLSVQRTVYSNATTLVVGDGFRAADLILTTGGTGHHYFQAGLTIAPAATLRGTGTITGNTTVNGTIAPGFSVGTLTFSNDLTLAGTTLMELDKENVAGSNDFIRVLSAFTFGGTLTVTNIGAALVDGDAFTLFGGTWTGDFALTNLPALTGILGWDTTQLGVTGTISVIVIPEPSTLVLVGLAGVLVAVARRRIIRAAN